MAKLWEINPATLANDAGDGEFTPPSVSVINTAGPDWDFGLGNGPHLAVDGGHPVLVLDGGDAQATGVTIPATGKIAVLMRLPLHDIRCDLFQWWSGWGFGITQHISSNGSVVLGQRTKVRGYAPYGTGSEPLVFDEAPTVGGWHVWTFSWTPTTVRMYRDAHLVHERTGLTLNLASKGADTMEWFAYGWVDSNASAANPLPESGDRTEIRMAYAAMYDTVDDEATTAQAILDAHPDLPKAELPAPLWGFETATMTNSADGDVDTITTTNSGPVLHKGNTSGMVPTETGPSLITFDGKKVLRLDRADALVEYMRSQGTSTMSAVGAIAFVTRLDPNVMTHGNPYADIFWWRPADNSYFRLNVYIDYANMPGVGTTPGVSAYLETPTKDAFVDGGSVDALDGKLHAWVATWSPTGVAVFFDGQELDHTGVVTDPRPDLSTATAGTTLIGVQSWPTAAEPVYLASLQVYNKAVDGAELSRLMWRQFNPASLNATWAAPAHDGGSPVTGYRVRLFKNDGTVRIIEVASTGAVSPFEASETGKGEISAVNALGESAPVPFSIDR